MNKGGGIQPMNGRRSFRLFGTTNSGAESLGLCLFELSDQLYCIPLQPSADCCEGSTLLLPLPACGVLSALFSLLSAWAN